MRAVEELLFSLFLSWGKRGLVGVKDPTHSQPGNDGAGIQTYKSASAWDGGGGGGAEGWGGKRRDRQKRPARRWLHSPSAVEAP